MKIDEDLSTLEYDELIKLMNRILEELELRYLEK